MGQAFHRQKHEKQKYTTADVRSWRKLMRDNGWNQKKLAEHLNESQKMISDYLIREAHDELRG